MSVAVEMHDRRQRISTAASAGFGSGQAPPLIARRHAAILRRVGERNRASGKPDASADERDHSAPRYPSVGSRQLLGGADSGEARAIDDSTISIRFLKKRPRSVLGRPVTVRVLRRGGRVGIFGSVISGVGLAAMKVRVGGILAGVGIGIGTAATFASGRAAMADACLAAVGGTRDSIGGSLEAAAAVRRHLFLIGHGWVNMSAEPFPRPRAGIGLGPERNVGHLWRERRCQSFLEFCVHNRIMPSAS